MVSGFLHSGKVGALSQTTVARTINHYSCSSCSRHHILLPILPAKFQIKVDKQDIFLLK